MEALRAVRSTSFGCLMEMIIFCDMLRSTKECTVAAADCASRAFRSLAVQVFGSPFGDNFGSLFDNFCDLKRHKSCLDCRHDSE